MRTVRQLRLHDLLLPDQLLAPHRLPDLIPVSIVKQNRLHVQAEPLRFDQILDVQHHNSCHTFLLGRVFRRPTNSFAVGQTTPAKKDRRRPKKEKEKKKNRPPSLGAVPSGENERKGRSYAESGLTTKILWYPSA
jgi:hypothetical protein